MESTSLLSDYGIIYGSKNKILAWHPGLDNAVLLAERNSDPDFLSRVTSIAYIDGQLYDACLGEGIRNTLTNEPIGTHFNHVNNRNLSPIAGIGEFNGRMIALRHVPDLFQGEYKDGYAFYPGGKLYYVEDDIGIALLGEPKDSESLKGGHDRKNLDFRNYSLNFVVAGDIIYVASENVVAVHPRPDGNFSKINRLTDYLTDHVHLVSNGIDVYSLSTHNSSTHPDGTELRQMPMNKRRAYWKPSSDGKGAVKNQASYGYARIGTLAGNILVIGTLNHSTDEDNLYAIPITSEMHEQESGLQAEPVLLLRNAMEFVFGDVPGNPMIAVSSGDLERIIFQSTVRRIPVSSVSPR